MRESKELVYLYRMKIHFIGLSSFLIENKRGYRVLVDPFNNAPEWSLGPKFPGTFKGKPFGANVVLMSEPDADHAYAPGGWLQNAPMTKPNSNPFPKMDLRGTIVYEYNGDVNIAWHYTIDGLRLAHFADNSHVLTKQQVSEFGHVDIIFVAAPKAEGSKFPESLDEIQKNIALLKPKIVIWAHHIVPEGMPKMNDSKKLRLFFQTYFEKYARTNKGYDDTDSFMEICYCLENAALMNSELQAIELSKTSIEITPQLLKQAKKKPIGILFKKMIARS